MKFEEKQHLVELLLKCQSIKSPQDRSVIIGKLPFWDDIKISEVPKVHVFNIVETCLNFDNGFKLLVKRLEYFDGETEPFKDLVEFLGEISFPENGVWLRYFAHLRKQVNTPIFDDEEFTLKQVYVPLRAYFYQETGASCVSQQPKYKKVAVDLESKINEWLESPEPNDAVRLIGGEPSSGKSAFAKILAAQIAEKNSFPVLFIPLHCLNLENGLEKGINDFVPIDEFVLEKLLDFKNFQTRLSFQTRLLIIFDGLDKLGMPNKTESEVIPQFLQEVHQTTHVSQHKIPVQFLITGQDSVVRIHANKFRKPYQVLYILPYFLNFSERRQYDDPEELLANDQRDEWWQKYGEAKGLDYTEMPSELKRDYLQEITAQPWLNYIVASMKLDFATETNLSRIYAYLLQTVYQRDREKNYPTIEINILEEIAVTIWHGNGQTASIIETRCGGLQKLWLDYKENTQQSLVSLLTAFYFHLHYQSDTFELTHKSLGEYLVARRIVNMLDTIKLVESKDSYDKALEQWVDLCGMTAIDTSLCRFIRDEICLRDAKVVAHWQKILGQLIQHQLLYCMPMHNLQPRPNFKEENRQARNAEEALLVVLNACARATRTISNLEWPSKTSFRDWVANLQRQHSADKENVFAFECFGYLNLDECILFWGNFSGANFENASLENTNFQGSNLERANFKRANLAGANFEGTNLQQANFEEANDVLGANFKGAKLEGAIDIPFTNGDGIQSFSFD